MMLDMAVSMFMWALYRGDQNGMECLPSISAVFLTAFATRAVCFRNTWDCRVFSEMNGFSMSPAAF